jgi:hypothetical protein
MLIDTREPQPLPRSHEPWTPNLRPLAPIPVGLFLLGVAGAVPPALSYLLILGGGGLIARTVAKLIPTSNGLEEHRQ